MTLVIDNTILWLFPFAIGLFFMMLTLYNSTKKEGKDSLTNTALYMYMIRLATFPVISMICFIIFLGMSLNMSIVDYAFIFEFLGFAFIVTTFLTAIGNFWQLFLVLVQKKKGTLFN